MFRKHPHQLKEASRNNTTMSATRGGLLLLAIGICCTLSEAANTQQQRPVATTAAAATDSATSRHNYFGSLIGKLQTTASIGNNKRQPVTGDVYAVDEQTLFIRGFTFDGLAPDTYFWSSVSSAAPTATAEAFIVPDEKGSTKPLERYSNKDVVLRLPEGKTLREINWLSIWSRQLKLSLADIVIPKNLIIPRPLEINGLSTLAHGVKSGPITIVDAQTFLVPEFHYDGLGPAGYFWLTRGSSGLAPVGLRLKDENGSWKPLRKYQGETVVISLPDELTIYDFDYFGVWCLEYQVNFGQTHIPQTARVPPSPKMLGIKPENKLNCEILYDDLGFEIRWVLDGDDIVMQLVGKIEPNEYMAFGLGKDDSKSDMNNADAVVAWVDRQTGQVHAIDYFLGSKAQCVNDPKRGSCPDVKLPGGGGDSLTLLHGAIVNGYSMVTFKRPQLGVDELYDQHVYSDGRQSVIWAIGTLNAHKEVGYHRLRTKANMFIDFARNPQWNCPIPDLNASMHNNLPITSASQVDQTVVSTSSSSSANEPQLAAASEESLPNQDQTTSGHRQQVADNIPTGSTDSPTTTTTMASPAPQATQAELSPWFIPSVVCPADRTFYAQIGPTGGRRGVAGLTGRASWGVSWYINGLMIPELVVERGQVYRFVVEGGNDKTSLSRRHPMYLTDSAEGGFNYRTDDERMKERIFGGVAVRPSDGQFVPTAEGRLCEWKATNQTKANPDLYSTFSAYQRSLRLDCLAGQAAILKFVPDANTPDQIYYQCYTNRFMGWKITVVDSCKDYLSGSATAANGARMAPANAANNRQSAPLKRHTTTTTSAERRHSSGPEELETMDGQQSEARMSFEPPPAALEGATDSSSGLEFGDELAASELMMANSGNGLTGDASDMVILNNSLLNQKGQPHFNLTTIEQILKLSPSDVEFLDDSQLDLVNALALASSTQQQQQQQQPQLAGAASDGVGPFQAMPIPLQSYLNLNAAQLQANGQAAKQNKTTSGGSISSKMVPKSLHNYMRRLASIYYPVQQQFASMLSGGGNNNNNAGHLASTPNQQQQHQQQQLALIHAALFAASQSQKQQQQTGEPAAAGSAPSSSFSLASLVPKPKIDLSKSNLSKKFNKLRIKSGRKYEAQQQQQQQQAAANGQQPKRPQPANEINYDIFNNQLAQLEKQQRQLQALESLAAASWPSQQAPPSPPHSSPSGDSFNYLPMFSNAAESGSGLQSSSDPSPESLMSIMSDSFQQGQGNYMHPNGAHQQPPPPRLSATRLGPPTPLGQQPFIVDYMSMGHPNRTEMPPMPPMGPPPTSHAVFVKRLPQHQHQHQQHQRPEQSQHHHHHHYHQQPMQMGHTVYGPNRHQEQEHQAMFLQQNQVVRYPNIKPYAPPNEQTRSKLSYLDSTDYSSNNRPSPTMSSMPSHTMTIHDQAAGEQQSQQPPSPANEHPTESLSGSGSGSHFAFRQQPGGQDASGSASVAQGDSDHMLAIERFSKQSSERRPPSIVHPVTGEQVIYGQQQQQQQEQSSQVYNQSTTSAAAPKRYSSMLIGGGRQLVDDPQQAPNRLVGAEILDTEQSAQAADLRRLNASDQSNLISLQQHQINKANDRQQQQQQPHLLTITSSSSGELPPSVTFIEAGQRLANQSSSNNGQAEQASQYHTQQVSQSTTESVPSVLLKPTGFNFFASDPPATATTTTTSTTTTPSVLSMSSPSPSSPEGSSTGPLVPSMGPPQMLLSNMLNQQQTASTSNQEGELVYKSTLIEPITSTLVPNSFIHQQQQLANTNQQRNFAMNQFLQNPMNFDSTPFIPLEFAGAANSQQPSQQQSQYELRLRPSPLVESMLSQYQSPFRPEPPVQVASYLAQQLAGGDGSGGGSPNSRNLLVSSERSVASSQPVTMSISLPTQQSPQHQNNQIQQRQSSYHQQATSGSHNNNNQKSSELIILKPAAMLANGQQQQTFMLKPEYLTNQFKPMVGSEGSSANNNNNNPDQDLSYASNELSNDTPTRRLIGHQFDRLSSLSSPPSTSMALDPMQAAPSSQLGQAAGGGAARPTTSATGGNPQVAGDSSSTKKNDSSTTVTTTTGSSNSPVRHIPGKLIPDVVQSGSPSLLYSSYNNQQQSMVQDRGQTNQSSNSQLYRDNNTDNAILSHVMSLISSNAIPTPPLIPVASYSNADYFLPISDHRSQRSITRS